MTIMTTQDTRDDLSRLVKERRDQLNRSVAKVAEMSGDPALNGSWVHRLETGQVKDLPKRERLEALARGLDLPAATVARAAAAQFWGVGEVWSKGGDARAVVDQMAEMDPDSQRAIRAMVEAFARNQRGG